MLRACFLAALVACSACASAARPAPPVAAPSSPLVVVDAEPARPPTIDERDEATAERAVSALERISAALQRANGDCARASAEIEALLPAAREDISSADGLDQELRTDAAGRDWFERTYGERVRAAGAPLLSSPCLDEQKLGELLGAMSQ